MAFSLYRRLLMKGAAPMRFPTLSRLWRSPSSHPPNRRKPLSTRLQLEALEDRSLLSFVAPVTSAGGGYSVAVGDFNHDGRDDVVVIRSATSVSVSLSKGDGSFQPPMSLTGAKGPLMFVYATDVNADGLLDIAAYGFSRKYQLVGCNVYYGYCEYSGTEYDNVWLGQGDGTFGQVSTTTHQKATRLGSWPTSPLNSQYVYADFNHDGVSDIAALDKNTGTVLVYLGNADGTQQPPQTYAAGPNPGSIAAGDFNGDGWIDVVVVDSLSSGNPKLSVLLNNGSW
jgi:hypothetical protein